MIVELKRSPLETSAPDDLTAVRSSPSSAHAERRRETRYVTNDPVAIRLLDAGGRQPVAGTVLNVSRSGLRVESVVPLGKGLQLEILLPDRTVIFGESRYCRRVSTGYHTGIAIEVVYYAKPYPGHHLQDDHVRLYAAGAGLTALEAIHVKNHLSNCGSCRERLATIETANSVSALRKLSCPGE
jgi:hypothetical protein